MTVFSRMKMVKPSIILLLFFLLFSDAFCQSHTENSIQKLVVFATVLDANTGESLPLAHIRVLHTSIGNVTNTDGAFRLILDQEYRDSTLVVSYMGYKSYAQKIRLLTGEENKIELEPIPIDLETVTVTPVDIFGILTKAIYAMKDFYWQSPIQTEAFYRETLFEQGKAKRLAEAACELQLTPYRTAFKFSDWREQSYNACGWSNLDRGFPLQGMAPYSCPLENKVKINEARTSDDGVNADVNFFIPGGPVSLLSSDWVNFKYKYLLEEKQNYKRTYKQIKKGTDGKIRLRHSEWENRPVYILTITRKDLRHYEFVIDKETSVIISYKMKFIFNQNWTIPASNKRVTNGRVENDILVCDSAKVHIQYRPWNGKWYYSNIQAEEYFTHKSYNGPENKLKVSRDLMFHSTQIKDVIPFAGEDCFPTGTYTNMYDFPMRYNPQFWENYNSLYPTKLQNETRESLEEMNPLNEQFERKHEFDTSIQAPIAKIVRDTMFFKNDTFPDNYAWINTESEDSVRKYVDEENTYSENFFLQYSEANRTLFDELANVYAIHKFSETIDDWQTKMIENYTYYVDKEYGDYGGLFRKLTDRPDTKELLVDFGLKYKKYPEYGFYYYMLNPDQSILQYCEFQVSSDHALEPTMIFMDINTKSNIDTIKTLLCYWVDNQSIVYPAIIGEEYGYRELYYSNIRTKESQLVYTIEPGAFLNLHDSNSKKYIFVGASKNWMQSEILFIDKSSEKFSLDTFISKQERFDYSIDHYKGRPGFYISTNENAPNYCLYKTKEDKIARKDWEIVIPEDKVIDRCIFTYVDSLFVFNARNGLEKQIQIYNESENEFQYLPVDQSLQQVTFHNSDSTGLILRHSNYTSPTEYFHYSLLDRKTRFIGKDSISRYSPEEYQSELKMVKSQDGEFIPLVLIFNKKARRRFGQSPVLLTTYGGGGNSYAPNLDPELIPLLKRGFVVAYAIVRGSGEIGQNWKTKANKKNAYKGGDDFASCASYLIDEKMTSADKLFGYGKSYGGFIMHYVANNYPGLFNGIILDVPFVDLINQLVDTTDKENYTFFEYFGSPYIPDEFESLKKLDPYQNIIAQDYPNMLFFGAWQDINVDPSNAIKSVAKLRATKTDNNLLLLRVLMNSGHSTSGSKYYKKKALIYSFIMHCLGENPL